MTAKLQDIVEGVFVVTVVIDKDGEENSFPFLTRGSDPNEVYNRVLDFVVKNWDETSFPDLAPRDALEVAKSITVQKATIQNLLDSLECPKGRRGLEGDLSPFDNAFNWLRHAPGPTVMFRQFG